MLGKTYDWRNVAKASTAALLALLLTLSPISDRSALAARGKARSDRAESSRAISKSAGKLTEVAAPAAIQELQTAFDDVKPQLSILSPRPNEVLSDNSVSVQFQVRDLSIYKDKTLGLGPHIHVFVDDQPYLAVYDTSKPLILNDLTPGTHTIRAFASRPWHESFKNEGAYAQTTFHIFTKTQENSPDSTLPLLTYSRPQGVYGEEPIMLDFYLTNAPLHLVAREDRKDDIPDWRIRCTVNGSSFILDQWQPIYLKGFKPGKNWVQLEFLDENGNPVNNVFNNTARVLTYEPGGQDTLSKLVRDELSAADARRLVDPNYKPPVPTPSPTPTPASTSSPSPRPTPGELPVVPIPVAPAARAKASPAPVLPAKPTVVPRAPVTPTPVPPAKPDAAETPGKPAPAPSPEPAQQRSVKSRVNDFFNRWRPSDQKTPSVPEISPAAKSLDGLKSGDQPSLPTKTVSPSPLSQPSSQPKVGEPPNAKVVPEQAATPKSAVTPQPVSSPKPGVSSQVERLPKTPSPGVTPKPVVPQPVASPNSPEVPRSAPSSLSNVQAQVSEKVNELKSGFSAQLNKLRDRFRRPTPAKPPTVTTPTPGGSAPSAGTPVPTAVSSPASSPVAKPSPSPTPIPARQPTASQYYQRLRPPSPTPSTAPSPGPEKIEAVR